jgi:hypothetical protein
MREVQHREVRLGGVDPVEHRVETPEETVADQRGISVVRTETLWNPGQIVLVAAGVLFLVYGIVALVRGGLSGAISEPSVDVFGFAHTPLLGLIEVGAGAVLLLAGLGRGMRTPGMLLGALVAVAGGLLLADFAWSREYLTTDPSFGWVPLAAGAAIVVVLGLVPSTRSHTTVWS